MQNLLFNVPAHYDDSSLAQLRIRREKLARQLSKHDDQNTAAEFSRVSTLIRIQEKKDYAATFSNR